MELKHNFHKTAKLVLGITAMLFAGFISLAAAAATVTYSPSFATGWNLAGNSLATPIDVKTSFGAQAGITTIWKWDAAGSKWAFYAPSLDTAGTLASYAAAKGYSVLSTINQGEGYWVNATAQVSLAQASGTGFSLAASNLVTGWNLVATGDAVTPAAFSTNAGNVTTLWAWDNANSAWYFYAPSLAANNTLASYISSKSYKDFGALTLGNGRGFWVNYAGAAASGAAGSGTPAGIWKLTVSGTANNQPISQVVTQSISANAIPTNQSTFQSTAQTFAGSLTQSFSTSGASLTVTVTNPQLSYTMNVVGVVGDKITGTFSATYQMSGTVSSGGYTVPINQNIPVNIQYLYERVQ